MRVVLLLLATWLCGGCDSQPPPATAEPIRIEAPEGLVLATSAQREFMARLRTLREGVDRDAVLSHLGPPEESQPEKLVYELYEQPQGGHYLVVEISFTERRVQKAVVYTGHITKTWIPED